MCGTILEIAAGDNGRRRSCKTCRRRFDVRFTEDVSTGQKGVSLHYLPYREQPSGDTSAIGSGTSSFLLPSVESPGASTLAEPEPPDEAHFKCHCGVILVASKTQYEKRGRCAACGHRMLVFLLFDPRARSFTLQTFNLIDQSSGKTQLLARL